MGDRSILGYYLQRSRIDSLDGRSAHSSIYLQRARIYSLDGGSAHPSIYLQRARIYSLDGGSDQPWIPPTETKDILFGWGTGQFLGFYLQRLRIYSLVGVSVHPFAPTYRSQGYTPWMGDWSIPWRRGRGYTPWMGYFWLLVFRGVCGCACALVCMQFLCFLGF